MTLAELANLICTKLGQIETEDLDACKTFLKTRFKMIWDDQLWKDSVFEYTQTLLSTGYANNSTWLPTKQVLLCPPVFARIMAVRTDLQKVNVTQSDTLYRSDFDVFQNSGVALQFRHLPACVWEFDVATECTALAESLADYGSVLKLDILDGDGVTVSRQNLTMVTGGSRLGTIQRIDSMTKLATTANVFVTANNLVADDTAYDPPLVSPGNYSLTLTGLTVGGVYLLSKGNSTLPNDDGFITQIISSIDIAGPSYSGLLPAAALICTTSLVSENDETLALAATDTAFPKRQRIQLLGPMATTTNLRVLGKTVAPTFEDDGDEPALTGVDNVLIAFAEIDMLERGRQYAKAGAINTRAASLLDQLKREEVCQQAFESRIVPADGFGECNQPLGWDFAKW